jgi:hypothetical protein
MKPMPKIFICYRHEDAHNSAKRLHDTLTGCFGAQYIFWDIDSIRAGSDFLEKILSEVDSSTTFLVVIGSKWLDIKKADGTRRIDDPKDFVRLEIARALGRFALERADRRERINIIPALVEGATLPDKQDLPDDLKKLVDHSAIKLSVENWRKDIKPLLPVIDRDFKANLHYSFIAGSIAGLIAGLIVGWLYWLSHHDTTVAMSRIFKCGLYGLFSGAVLSYFIHSAITWRSRIVNKSQYSKIIDATAGGAIGGIIAGITGGFLFDDSGGGPVHPKQLALAVASASIFVILAILFPELKGAWHKPVMPIIIIACVTVVTISIVWWVINKRSLDYGGPHFFKGVLILGLIFGMMSGFQVGSALFIYDHFKYNLEKNS